MEHPGAAPTSVDDSLFSERVRLWLDEGDRLEAEVAARPAAESPVEPGHVGQALRRLGERAARHRVTVLASLGLLPLLLLLATHRGAPPPALSTVAVAAAAAPARAAVVPAPVLSPLFSPAPETAPLIAVREPVPVAPSRSVAHPPSRRAKAHRHRRHPVAQRAAARR